MSEQSKDELVGEPERDRERRGIVAGWGCLPVGVAVMLAVVLVGAVGAAGWWLGSSNDDEGVEFEEATSIGRDPFTTDGLILASAVKDVPGPSSTTNVPATPTTQLFGGSGDQKVCDPAAIVSFLEANPKKAAAWVAALNADKFLSWSGGRRKVQVGEIAAYVAELTPSVLAVDTRVTNHGYKNGKATPRQSTLAKGTAVLVDSHGIPRVRCACGNPLAVHSGFTVTPQTSTSVDVTTTDPPASTTTTGDIVPTTTIAVCGSVPPLSDALQVTTAPVDFDGDGTPDVLRVYRLGVVWHARVEIAGVVIDDDVIAGPGPTMAAIGGATVDGDAFEEAWIRVGGTPPGSAIVGLFTFRGCDMQRVVSDEDGAPYAFPINLSSSQTYGLRCLGSNAGIEQLEMTSTDGGATYTGSGQEYTLLASFSPPTMAPGMTNTYTETNSSPGFPPHHQFTCDGLGPTIP